MKHIIFFTILIVLLGVSAQAQSVRIIKPPQALVNYLYKTAAGKENLQKIYQGNLKAAVSDLLVKSADVDGDRRPEYFVSSKSLCQNVDCTVTLYKQKGITFVVLASAPQLDVNQGWSEGRRNLISCEAQAAQPRCSFLRWYKKEYVQYRCVEADSKKSSLKSKEIPCSQAK
jgi:hypothetical protein